MRLFNLMQLRSLVDRFMSRRFVPVAGFRRGIVAVVAIAGLFSLPVFAQGDRASDSPNVVRPGAPGQPTKELPAGTRATLPPRSAKDVEFMQGMIMHHAQAVEMTALIQSRTQNKELRLLGARISKSQADEIDFMKRWLESRSETTSLQMANMSGMNGQGMKMPDMKMDGMDTHSPPMLMPGMLTPKQMEALRNSKGTEFDRLFLSGMIQHHDGALIMVEDLFNTAGAGQDAELFNFATDVDSGQRAEIKIMETMLRKLP